jgi:photosystem II stability/assembly factor-like uncharacterized protein
MLFSAAAVLAASGGGSASTGSWGVGPLTPVGPDASWAYLSQASVTGDGPFAEEVALTVDGGRSWADRAPPGLGAGTMRRSVAQVAAVSTKDAWVSYGGLVDDSPKDLMATQDGGRHWVALGRLPSPYCSLQFLSATVGWCTVSLEAMDIDPVIIYRSADGGRHWQLESRSPTLQAPGTAGSLPNACDKLVSFSTPSVGWAASVCAGGTSPLYETTDAGRTWARCRVGPLPAGYHLSSGLPAVWATAVVSAGRLGAVGMSVEGPGQSLVYRSTNGGSSWRAVAPPGPPHPWNVVVVNPSTWKLTYKGTVLTTTDAGRTWQPGKSNLALPAQSLQYVTAEDGWYVPVVASELERTEDGGASWHQVTLPPFPG